MQSHYCTSKASPLFDKVGDLSEHPRTDNDFKFNKKVDQECFVAIESNSDILGPETPGVRPLVPRFKRVQEETPKFESKHDSSSFNPGKKLKILPDSICKPSNKNEKDTQDPTSKFEWLDPSRIRDGNRRRPDDPLYDKRTLYIPPEALGKMSASQRQYWSVKCQYMDVVLFFKVVSFFCFSYYII